MWAFDAGLLAELSQGPRELRGNDEYRVGVFAVRSATLTDTENSVVMCLVGRF